MMEAAEVVMLLLMEWKLDGFYVSRIKTDRTKFCSQVGERQRPKRR